jgi:hypothetical protein
MLSMAEARCASTSNFDALAWAMGLTPSEDLNAHSKSGSLIQINGQAWNTDPVKASEHRI